MLFENFLTIECYTERMTKDWNQERYTVRKYHKWTKRPRNKFNKKQTKYQEKNEHTTYGGKKNEKLCNKENLLTIYGGKSNNSTMTKENLTYNLWRKKNYSKKKTELWLITYSSAKEWMLQRISRYTQKHNWIVLYKF